MKVVNDVKFQPDVAEFEAGRTDQPLTVLCGLNNCGKSLLLKHVKRTKGKSAYMMGVNRFYHVFYLQPRQMEENEIDQFESNFQSHFNDIKHNHEQNFIDLQRLISGLKDTERTNLFDICSRLLGNQLSLKREDEENELSLRYIDMDGYNVSVGSTGTRLLLTILGTCIDNRFSTILIDEPELGLGPKIQNALSRFLQDTEQRQKYFPHLEQIYIATHSHLFLSRANIRDNFWISKDGATISIEQIKNIQDFHRLQFNLIGNDFETIFLPSAILFVEGKTDFRYLDRIIRMRFPDRKITVVDATGDPKRKVHSLREAFGDLSESPFQSRLFVVLDSVHDVSLQNELRNMGVKKDNIIIWSKNGIEYLYPPQILMKIFTCDDKMLDEMKIIDDTVTINGIERKKSALCEEVLNRVDGNTQFPDELDTKLLSRLSEAIS